MKNMGLCLYIFLDIFSNIFSNLFNAQDYIGRTRYGDEI